MNYKVSGSLCLLFLAVGAVAAALPAAAQSRATEAPLPDPVLLEILRFPARGVDEVPSQQAYADWPPQALRQRPYWLPWNWRSFQRAGLFSRPVLFVMTVNWSQQARTVLAGPLSSPETLELANQHYVSVLVNADRRPDLKDRYQTGDWPVIAFLLPDGNPMLSQANDMGVARPITTSQVDTATLAFLLTEGDKYWKKWPQLLLEVGAEWARRGGEDDGTPGVPDELASDQVAMWLEGNADQSAGGFGAAPKFIVHGFAEYAALRAARLKNDLRSHSRLTLEQLVASPLFDAEEGGIHRMAAAPGWEGIQYEKRLVGNTALVQQLLFALREDDSAPLTEALRKTAGYIVQVLGRPGGGFYNAQVADPTTPDGSGYWRRAVRDPRRAPPIDRLVLAGPNALAGGALVRAGLYLEDDALVQAGRGALEMVRREALTKGQGVLHVIDPQPDGRIFLTAQADVALGFLDAYESLGERHWLDEARDIVDFAWAQLREEGDAAVRDRIPVGESVGLLASPRFPLTPNARLARAMTRLALHGAGASYRENAGTILAASAGNLAPFGVQATESALAIEEHVRDPLVITIGGAVDASKTAALRAAALRSPWPWTVVSPGAGNGKSQAEFQWRGETTRADSPGELSKAILAATGLDRR